MAESATRQGNMGRCFFYPSNISNLLLEYFALLVSREISSGTRILSVGEIVRHISSEQPEEDHFISEAEDEGSVIGQLELKHTVSWHLTVQTSSSFLFTIFPSLYFPSRAR